MGGLGLKGVFGFQCTCTDWVMYREYCDQSKLNQSVQPRQVAKEFGGETWGKVVRITRHLEDLLIIIIQQSTREYTRTH